MYPTSSSGTAINRFSFVWLISRRGEGGGGGGGGGRIGNVKEEEEEVVAAACLERRSVE